MPGSLSPCCSGGEQKGWGCSDACAASESWAHPRAWLHPGVVLLSRGCAPVPGYLPHPWVPLPSLGCAPVPGYRSCPSVPLLSLVLLHPWYCSIPTTPPSLGTTPNSGVQLHPLASLHSWVPLPSLGRSPVSERCSHPQIVLPSPNCAPISTPCSHPQVMLPALGDASISERCPHTQIVLPSWVPLSSLVPAPSLINAPAPGANPAPSPCHKCTFPPTPCPQPGPRGISLFSCSPFSSPPPSRLSNTNTEQWKM